MNLKLLILREQLNKVSRFNGRLHSAGPSHCKNFSTITSLVSTSSYSLSKDHGSVLQRIFTTQKMAGLSGRYFHSTRLVRLSQASIDPGIKPNDFEGDDGTMNEFLSRFVWIMRGKLSGVYSKCDKETINGMLSIIVANVVDEMEKGGIEKKLGTAVAAPSQDFSQDLWGTVWEVSNMVLQDMEKARKKEKMKKFLQSGEVKEMYRFASEAGIRGDLLRELRFKWALEKMEETEFYVSLERLREEEQDREKEEGKAMHLEVNAEGAEDKPDVASILKRKGKIRYKIYGLDLSDPKWAEVADKLHDAEEIIVPKEPKPISGKSKLVMEKILLLREEDDPSPLLAEWIELLQPSRADWITLLDRLEQKNAGLYLKVAESLLDEKSFQGNIRDYTKLIDAHAKKNHIEDAERVLKKMGENGIFPDILTSTLLVHMYSKAGNLDRAKEAFESLRSFGFHPDQKVYNSMILAYVNAGQPKLGESLMREMEARDIKPSEEIYLALLRSFAQSGDVGGAGRIATTMQFSGFQPTLESFTLLVETYAQAGDPDQARHNFDHMIKLGFKPNDRCTASMIAAYERKNLLDKALNLLLQLEKDGFVPGAATYAVLVDWFGKMQLVDEAEQLLGKIAEQGEVPPFKIHVSLCDMYSRAGVEKKALQALGVLEAKKEELGAQDFERIVNALIAGGFMQEAKRLHGIMEAQGFAASDQLKVALMASQTFTRKRPTMR
ncbi:hypothetical protein SLE2022_094450 [Rubroshorea leprosula]